MSIFLKDIHDRSIKIKRQRLDKPKNKVVLVVGHKNLKVKIPFNQIKNYELNYDNKPQNLKH